SVSSSKVLQRNSLHNETGNFFGGIGKRKDGIREVEKLRRIISLVSGSDRSNVPVLLLRASVCGSRRFYPLTFVHVLCYTSNWAMPNRAMLEGALAHPGLRAMPVGEVTSAMPGTANCPSDGSEH